MLKSRKAVGKTAALHSLYESFGFGNSRGCDKAAIAAHREQHAAFQMYLVIFFTQRSLNQPSAVSHRAGGQSCSQCEVSSSPIIKHTNKCNINIKIQCPTSEPFVVSRNGCTLALTGPDGDRAVSCRSMGSAERSLQFHCLPASCQTVDLFCCPHTSC